MNLSQTDWLEHIEGRTSECPVDNRPQLEQEGRVVPGLVGGFWGRVITAKHKTAFFHFGQSVLDLPRTKREVNTEQQVEPDQVLVFPESVTVLDALADGPDVGEPEEREQVDDDQNAPQKVKSENALELLGQVVWNHPFLELLGFFLRLSRLLNALCGRFLRLRVYGGVNLLGSGLSRFLLLLIIILLILS